jgi:hypothetical protein
VARRTTNEAPLFRLWRDPAAIAELVHADLLTTARCEPILRRQLGGSHVDLLFENGARSMVVGGVQIHGPGLLLRERSPLIWPASLVAVVDDERLTAIEGRLIPWLRSIARARSMAAETIRRFAPSARFERARAAGLVGAGRLEGSILRMAPFVYARRFARGAALEIACADAALGYAVLADLARSIRCADPVTDDERFAFAWYGVPASRAGFAGRPDVLITADVAGSADAAAIIIDTRSAPDPRAAVVTVPLPAPWDLLFSFDPSDAPPAGSFGVIAPEPQLALPAPLRPAATVGGSAGTIVIAVSQEAFAAHGPDMDEIEVLGQRLGAEGFAVFITSRVDEPKLTQAALVHIVGAPFEEHTVVFAEHAQRSGIDFVFDLCPQPADTSAFLENSFVSLFRAAIDDADIARYLEAYERGNLDPYGVPEVSSDHHPRIAARFAELARHALGILAPAEDVETLRALLPPSLSERIRARGVFVRDEPVPAPIGHLVPREPFAFAFGPIAMRSHSFYTAIAAERHGIPLVIAGPVYDANYLQVIAANAPSAIVLADLDRAAVSALFRAASVYVDAAPRPRSTASLVRAVSCGTLPVLASDSPLARSAGDAAPVFPLKSLDDCARALRGAMQVPDRRERLDNLAARLLPRRDPATALASVIAAYSRVPAVV